MTGPTTAAAATAPEPPGTGPAGRPHPGSRGALLLAALGIVFGDIGTSPLYALQTVFSIDDGAVRPTEGDVYGVVSMMFWSITLIVSVKYIGVLMRADNGGEGGVMALTALARRLYADRTTRTAPLVVLGDPALRCTEDCGLLREPLRGPRPAEIGYAPVQDGEDLLSRQRLRAEDRVACN